MAYVMVQQAQKSLPLSIFSTRGIASWKTAMAISVLLALGGLALLSVAVSQQAFSDADLQIARWVKGLQFPGLDAILRSANALTGAAMAITLWVIVGAVLVLRGRPLEAIAVFMISGLWMGNYLLRMLVDRPSPLPELIPIVEFSRGASFPSGHVAGAVAFYGLLTFLTLRNVRRGHLRIAVPVLSALAIGLASLGRVYVSAHWPSDVLGSYLFGFIGVVAIAALYTSVKEDRFHLPRLRRVQPEPVPNGMKIARSIASVVYLDEAAGTAAKEYRPPMVVRALHRLAFQAPFAYQRNKAALDAAAAKRKIAGLLTKHQYGQDMVAPVLEIRNVGGNYQFVTGVRPR